MGPYNYAYKYVYKLYIYIIIDITRLYQPYGGSIRHPPDTQKLRNVRQHVVCNQQDGQA